MVILDNVGRPGAFTSASAVTRNTPAASSHNQQAGLWLQHDTYYPEGA